MDTCFIKTKLESHVTHVTSNSSITCVVHLTEAPPVSASSKTPFCVAVSAKDRRVSATERRRSAGGTAARFGRRFVRGSWRWIGSYKVGLPNIAKLVYNFKEPKFMILLTIVNGVYKPTCNILSLGGPTLENGQNLNQLDLCFHGLNIGRLKPP